MRIFLALTLLAALAGCATKQPVTTPTEVLSSSAYRHPGPPSITVMTMVNNRSGGGGHTALLINGSQRVIFDPAGSFKHPSVPENGDVLYGITPGVLAGYKSAHARSTYHVASQTIQVTPQQAETALRLAMNYGNVGDARCTVSSTEILSQVPGFSDIKQTWFPANLMRQLEQRPGVVTDRYYEDDEGDIVDGVAKVQL